MRLFWSCSSSHTAEYLFRFWTIHQTKQHIWICTLGWSRKPKFVAQTTRRCCKSKRTDLAVCLLHDPTFFAKCCQTTDTPQGFFLSCSVLHCCWPKKKQSLWWHRSGRGLWSEDWGYAMVASCQSQGSHTLKPTLLYCLFHSTWDNNLDNMNIRLCWRRLQSSDWDHKLTRHLLLGHLIKWEEGSFFHKLTYKLTL